MMRVALIRSGIVINVCERGSEQWTPPPDTEAVELAPGSPVERDWTYAGGSFSAPPIPPLTVRAPLTVTIRQLREALIDSDQDTQIDAAIAALPAGKAKRRLINAWERGGDVVRGGPLAGFIKQTLGMDNQQMAQLFIAASAA
jgi:hypothetical protein